MIGLAFGIVAVIIVWKFLKWSYDTRHNEAEVFIVLLYFAFMAIIAATFISWLIFSFELANWLAGDSETGSSGLLVLSMLVIVAYVYYVAIKAAAPYIAKLWRHLEEG